MGVMSISWGFDTEQSTSSNSKPDITVIFKCKIRWKQLPNNEKYLDKSELLDIFGMMTLMRFQN